MSTHKTSSNSWAPCSIPNRWWSACQSQSSWNLVATVATTPVVKRTFNNMSIYFWLCFAIAHLWFKYQIYILSNMAFLIVGRTAWRCEVHTVHSMHSIWKSRWCSESSSVIFSIYKYMYNCKYSCHHHVLWLSCWSFSLSSIIAPSMFSQSVDTPQTILFGLLHILLSEENLHRDSALSATSRWLYWNPTLMAPNDGPPNTRSLQLCTSCTTILSYSRKIVYTYFGQLSYLDCTMKIKNPLNIFIFLNQCLPDIITIYPCIWAGKTAVRQVCLDHTALLGCSSA